VTLAIITVIDQFPYEIDNKLPNSRNKYRLIKTAF